MKNQKGISLIALIITIIVIIILAAIVITMSLSTPEQASFAAYCNAMGALQEKVTLAYGEVYTDHAIANESKTRAQIYYEVATGTEGEPTGTSTKISSETYVGELPEITTSADTNLEYYITLDGLVFNMPAFEYDGKYYFSNLYESTTNYSSADDIVTNFPS